METSGEVGRQEKEGQKPHPSIGSDPLKRQRVIAELAASPLLGRDFVNDKPRNGLVDCIRRSQGAI